MSPSTGFGIDVASLETLAGKLDTIAYEVEAIVTKIDRVPDPAAAAYGWRPTAEAMTAVLAAWSPEVDLLRRSCANMCQAARSTVEQVQLTDSSVAATFGS